MLLDDATNVVVLGKDARLLFRFSDGTEFACKRHDNRICVSSGQASEEELSHYLIDQVIPRLIADEGELVLHAGGVVVDGRAHLFIGPSGVGKSTLCAGLARHGAVILSDDAIILREDAGQWMAEPIYPGLRLLPDSLSELEFAAAKLSDVASYTQKQRVLSDVALSDVQVPLGGLFLLCEDPAARVTVKSSSHVEACIELLAQSFTADPARSAAERFTKVTRLVGALGVRHMHYPRKYDIFPQILALLRQTPIGSDFP